MPSFSQADDAYRSALEAPGCELSAAFAAARQVRVALDGNDLTRAVLLRLRSFLLTQDLIKAELDKVYAAPAADFFVETASFFLRIALEQLAPDLETASEKSIVPRAGALRPDITVWRDGLVVAAVECKTQLGWNRDGWLEDFEAREKRLVQTFPKAKMYLLVLTGSNWGGFGEDPRAGTQFFVLMRDARPREFNEESTHLIMHRFEELVRTLISNAGV